MPVPSPKKKGLRGKGKGKVPSTNGGKGKGKKGKGKGKATAAAPAVARRRYRNLRGKVCTKTVASFKRELIHLVRSQFLNLELRLDRDVAKVLEKMDKLQEAVNVVTRLSRLVTS